ncbi:MAG: D-aminoacyl-tRNA deacylase [Candidatus Caldatribacteriota bacterium]|nr:D-aminoacyl-tRNA deacylase [Atribacterota bacterium]MDD3030924.1 D-aminoacyl-tRNA deacylase [Atribacterota bacterium]MDD3640461.1 D-aminoacyl-tRNA deacylase [Atribacterota bacterium]MDD4288605.1 D-aminoacyl-tRNA deacylase [Atribacterota bacterium]MDD4765395.1 D-aminoacyl-tRNA deacylase [Atribacterota bacterium]
MRAVIQRVSKASVKVDNQIVSEIDSGMVVLLGVKKGDTKEDAEILAKKTVNLRIFSDKEDKMNLSLSDISGKVIVVSQFTLYANCKKGRRPSFIEAALPEEADILYKYYIQKIENENIIVKTGIFQAMMQVEIINEGPVTIVLDSDKL